MKAGDMQMTPTERIAALKPGDSFEFAENYRWGPRVLESLVVERFTNTMIICRVGKSSREVRYRLSTGCVVGDRYGSFPEPVTEEEALQLRKEARVREIANRLSNVKWPLLELVVLEQVSSLISTE